MKELLCFKLSALIFADDTKIKAITEDHANGKLNLGESANDADLPVGNGTNSAGESVIARMRIECHKTEWRLVWGQPVELAEPFDAGYFIWVFGRWIFLPSPPLLHFENRVNALWN